MTPTRRVSWVMWLARFDVEPLLSASLRYGTWLCFLLALGSLVLQWTGSGGATLGDRIHARSLPSLLMKDLGGGSLRVSWSRLLLDGSVAALLLTPYLRLLVSLIYFVCAERNRRYTLLTLFVLMLVTIIVLTDLV